MHKPVDIVVIALSAPLLIGIYENNKLIDRLEFHEHTSEILPTLFESLLNKYHIEHLIYAKGPGSFMAIKISYIFLKSLSILKKIPFLATDAFYFNENRPIKAVGKLYFVKTSTSIETQTLETADDRNFELPDSLRLTDFNTDTVPFYGIGAV